MIGVLIITLLILYLINFYKKVKSLPPGPLPLPFIGNLYLIDLKQLHLWIYEQKKIYGNVFTIWIPHPQVVFADYDSIDESLQKNADHFIGRNVNGFPEKTFHENVNAGVIMSEGEEWKDQRRLSIQILRNFGMSKTIMQDKIHLVIQDSWDYLESLKNKNDVKIDKVIQLAVGNIINSILFGYMHTHNNSDSFFKFVSALELSIKTNSKWEMKLLSLIPSIDKIPIIKDILYKRLVKVQRQLRELSNIELEKCLKTYNSEEEPTNFIHAVMKEMKENDSKYSYLKSYHLQALVLDFWIAGLETSATTLKWFILLIMKHQDIQEKLHEEIDRVIGKENLVQLSDKVNMPYMNAFISEGQRYINMVPFVPSHKCTKDTIINGYLIPKDTLTQPFFWGANRDEKYFNDPFTFNPKRFLDDDEKTYKIEHDHMSFGKGKRICAGKSLADAEIFLFFTSFLQKYKFSHPNGPVDLSCDFSDVLLPRKYTCKIENR
ncbi:Cytochrome P450 18a1 [Strongyloides ratti]|uniref:Cytochrome P450 18a1 n=1 Tax=Strongyloides ratti TaxID=34506 RepID=A0A090L437_STRRB|nr:Cytochrome P450 18a1 [Strongyloides ratti]CEF62877.1 Cytochrome P450 18a1 [Strongyloides ratti]